MRIDGGPQQQDPRVESMMDPYKPMTSFRLEGPKGDVWITLSRLTNGAILVRWTTGSPLKAPQYETHEATYNSHERALKKAGDICREMIRKRVVG